MPLPRPNIFNINWWLVGPHYIVLNGALSISLNVRVVLLAITLHIVKATKLLQKKCNMPANNNTTVGVFSDTTQGL